jgi:eukaryotic-like serine/threonine-protein kinase
MSEGLPLSGDHVCDRGHRWQMLPACPVCGAAPRKSAEASGQEQSNSASLPVGALPPVVSALPPLNVLDRQPRSGAPPAELPQVPGYEVLQVLGQGAMGVVYLAWQTGLARLVALKTVLAGGHAGPEARARFHTEAEAAARLVHPHIVQIYEIGECDGQPFLAMEFVEEGNLSARLNCKPQPAQAAAAFVAMLAEAVHHAHQRGIIHRDLKPANILLVPKTPVQGHTTMHGGASSPDLNRFEPKITDFGLAKLVIGGISRTARGAILGTPAYMAPEQASGALEPVGPAADIHSLGAILYELLTGRPPFLAASVPETLEHVRRLEPVSPRRLVATIPRDLNTVCLKCLRKEPARRYESAQALAEDLRRVQAGEPIRGRLVPVWGRGLRWVRRHPAWAALLLVSCLAVAVLTASAVSLAYDARLQTLHTGLEAAVAQVKTSQEALSRLDRWVHYVRDIRLADEAWQAGQVLRLRELLDGCPADLRGWEWYYLHGLSSKTSQEYRAFPKDGTTVLGARFSPDDGRLIDVAQSGTIRIWDVKTGNLLQQQSADLDRPRSIAFRSDAQLLAAAGSHGTIKCWDLAKAQALSGIWQHDAPARAVAFSPDGRRLASSSDDGKVKICDVSGGAQPFICSGHTPPIAAVAFSPDSRLLASGGTDGVRFWDAGTGQEVPALPDPTPGVTAMAFGPDGHLAVAQMGGHITRWDLAGRRRLSTLIGHSSLVGALAFTPDGTRLASASRDRTVRLWDTARGQEVLPLHGFASEVIGVAFSADGRRLVTAELTGFVKLWEIEREE